MSDQGTNEPIAEAEIRDALLPCRPNAERFDLAVRRRIGAVRRDRPLEQDAEASPEDSPWLATAAALIPAPLLVGKTVAGAGGKLAAVQAPWGAKAVGWLAAPGVSLLLAMGGFVLGLRGIRAAQRRAAAAATPDESEKTAKLQGVMWGWWTVFGGGHVALCLVMVVSMWSGFALPALLIFTLYGGAIVLLVSRLGRAGWIDRSALTSGLVPALMLFAQLLSGLTPLTNGGYLLDQSLAAAVIALGAMGIAWFTAATASGLRERLSFGAFGLAMALMVALFGASVLAPVTEQTVRRYVETADASEFGSATWRRWAVAASWMRDTGRRFNEAKPLALFRQELAEKKNVFVMASGIRGGIVDEETMPAVLSGKDEIRWLTDPEWRDRRILSVEQREAEVVGRQRLGLLNAEEQSVLIDRLVATIDDAAEGPQGDLLEVLAATRMLQALETGEGPMPIEDPALAERVGAMLLEFQRLEATHLGARSGGFALHRKTNHGDEVATVAAIELMEVYGVPAELDMLALHSFLRPQNTEWLNARGGVLRFVARRRLAALPGARSPTWWDYTRREPILGMAVLTVLLSAIAVAGARPEGAKSRQQSLAWPS